MKLNLKSKKRESYSVLRIIYCKICGNMRIVKYSRISLNNNTYCSQRCFGKTLANKPKSIETRQKIRQYKLGKKATLETRLKLSQLRQGTNNSFFGKHHTIETKRKLSLTNKGKPAWNKGKKHKPESIIKMRLAKLGNKYALGKKRSPETLMKMRLENLSRPKPSPLKGRPFTQEHRNNISKSRLGKFCGINSHIFGIKRSEDTKQKIRLARLKQIIPTKDTKPERMMQLALSLEGIKFRKHEPITGQPDIFIEPNMCIFVDGDYPHGNPLFYKADDPIFGRMTVKEKWAKDIKINHELTNKGYFVIRIWQSDIEKDVGIIAKNIINSIKGIKIQDGYRETYKKHLGNAI